MEEGSTVDLDALLPSVYEELRRLARGQMNRERSDHTLQATALVHEALIRLQRAEIGWRDRAHLLGIATRVMRQVLVEHARARKAAKRGGEPIRVTISEATAFETPGFDMIAVDEALTTLAKRDERQARVVELRYIGGLTLAEIAETIGISEATVDRDLRHGRAWLKRALKAAGT